MTRTLYEVIQSAVGDNAFKLAGISHLLKSYSSDGTEDRDNEDMRGLGDLIQSLSDEGMRIQELMDSARHLPMDTQITLRKYNRDPIGAAQRVVDKLRAQGSTGKTLGDKTHE